MSARRLGNLSTREVPDVVPLLLLITPGPSATSSMGQYRNQGPSRIWTKAQVSGQCLQLVLMVMYCYEARWNELRRLKDLAPKDSWVVIFFMAYPPRDNKRRPAQMLFNYDAPPAPKSPTPDFGVGRYFRPIDSWSRFWLNELAIGIGVLNEQRTNRTKEL